MERVIDARNIACPGPVIEAKKALKEGKGGTLRVLVDNTAAVQNLTKLAAYMGLEVKAEKIDEKNFYVDILAGEAGENLPADEAEAACLPDCRRKGQVVVISADHMGEGDEVLGRALMKGFVYALTNLETLPETILLYNSGARLSVEGSESLVDLKLLESQGVEVLTCGTCLNHYGLTEKLAVGTVTNMYDIAERLTRADTVVRP